jgi:hypothetical protein
LKLAFNVAWKTVAVVVAGIIVAFVLILALVFISGGGLGDPCPPYC